MITKYYFTLLLFSATLCGIAQNNVCTNSNDDMLDLHTIGKCAIEKFKSSKSKEFINVSSRSRYVRRGENTHLKKLKEHLKTVPEKKEPVIAVTKDNIAVNKATSYSTKSETSSGEAVIKDFMRFDQVTKSPIFITCDNANSNEVREQCNKETVLGVLLDNLVYPFDAAAEGIEGQVWVRFIIDDEGYVTNVTTKGPENGTLLEQEAERLVKLLPKFIPGKHNEQYVSVEYFMPIEFHID